MIGREQIRLECFSTVFTEMIFRWNGPIKPPRKKVVNQWFGELSKLHSRLAPVAITVRGLPPHEGGQRAFLSSNQKNRFSAVFSVAMPGWSFQAPSLDPAIAGLHPSLTERRSVTGLRFPNESGCHPRFSYGGIGFAGAQSRSQTGAPHCRQPHRHKLQLLGSTENSGEPPNPCDKVLT